MFEEIAVTSNFSAKLILAVSRRDSAANVLQLMNEASQLTKEYPNTLIGFDLDGPEVYMNNRKGREDGRVQERGE